VPGNLLEPPTLVSARRQPDVPRLRWAQQDSHSPLLNTAAAATRLHPVRARSSSRVPEFTRFLACLRYLAIRHPNNRSTKSNPIQPNPSPLRPLQLGVPDISPGMVGVGEASTVKEAKKMASAGLLARLQGAGTAVGAGVSVGGGAPSAGGFSAAGGSGFGVGGGGRGFASPAAYHSGDPYSPSAGGGGGHGCGTAMRPGVGGGSAYDSAYDSHPSGPSAGHYTSSLSMQSQAPQAPPDAASTLNVRLQTLGFLNPADALRETGRAHVSDMPEWWQLGLEIRELGVSAVGQGGTVKAARKDAAAKLLAQLEGSSGGGGGGASSAAGGGVGGPSPYGVRPSPLPSSFPSSAAPAYATSGPSAAAYRPQAAAPLAAAAGRPPPHHPAHPPYGPTGTPYGPMGGASGGGYEYSFGHPSPAAAYPMHTAMPAAHGHGYGYNGEGSPESGHAGSSSVGGNGSGSGSGGAGGAPLSQTLLVEPPPHVLAAMRGISSGPGGPSGMPGASSVAPGLGTTASGAVAGGAYPGSGPSRPTAPPYGYAGDELPPWVQGSSSGGGGGSAGWSGRGSAPLPPGAFEGPSSARSSVSAGGASIGSGGGTSSRRGSGSLLGPPPALDPRRAGAGVSAGSSGSIGSSGGVDDSAHSSGSRTGGE
jgi:hypothetical protein